MFILLRGLFYGRNVGTTSEIISGIENLFCWFPKASRDNRKNERRYSYSQRSVEILKSSQDGAKRKYVPLFALIKKES